MLIVYGATAGVSVVQLYAGAFFPGLMLAGLYIVYVIVLAQLKPHLMPPLPLAQRQVDLPPATQVLAQTLSTRALPALLSALKGRRNEQVPLGHLLRQLGVTLLPLLLFVLVALWSHRSLTAPVVAEAAFVPQQEQSQASGGSGLAEPPGAEEAPAGTSGLSLPPGAEEEAASAPAEAAAVAEPPGAREAAESAGPREAPRAFWIGLGAGALALLAFYALLSFERLEIFKMLLASFFPLVVLILAVLGSIVFGLATPTEAAAVGASGGLLLAAAYKQLNFTVVKESVFLTAKTSAMVCWLFVGSAIFSAAFALLGGQELVERWVMSMNLSKTEFLILSQFIIFILGWPLEWTEIIVIFMPIFIPLLDNFGIDPLFFGLLVALNLQTAFLSPPVAMAAFYLKGVSPPHVTLNQIFAGMLPFMGIQVIAIVLLYIWPEIGLWLPQLLYGR
jgi:TRAP-type mannitol/chloroaromatic compound transport system permease large subunit